jgi:hypothetical protein
VDAAAVGDRLEHLLGELDLLRRRAEHLLGDLDLRRCGDQAPTQPIRKAAQNWVSQSSVSV